MLRSLHLYIRLFTIIKSFFNKLLNIQFVILA